MNQSLSTYGNKVLDLLEEQGVDLNNKTFLLKEIMSCYHTMFPREAASYCLRKLEELSRSGRVS